MFSTIVGKNGEIFHGIITCWLTNDEFMFAPQGSGGGRQFWGKTDYWTISHGYPIFRI